MLFAPSSSILFFVLTFPQSFERKPREAAILSLESALSSVGKKVALGRISRKEARGFFVRPFGNKSLKIN